MRKSAHAPLCTQVSLGECVYTHSLERGDTQGWAQKPRQAGLGADGRGTDRGHEGMRETGAPGLRSRASVYTLAQVCMFGQRARARRLVQACAAWATASERQRATLCTPLGPSGVRAREKAAARREALGNEEKNGPTARSTMQRLSKEKCQQKIPAEGSVTVRPP